MIRKIRACPHPYRKGEPDLKQRITQWLGVPLILLILLIILAIGFSNGEIVSAAAILRGLSP